VSLKASLRTERPTRILGAGASRSISDGSRGAALGGGGNVRTESGVAADEAGGDATDGRPAGRGRDTSGVRRTSFPPQAKASAIRKKGMRLAKDVVRALVVPENDYDIESLVGVVSG
jgi:hypothetical protein